MNRKFFILIFIMLAVALVGCGTPRAGKKIEPMKMVKIGDSRYAVLPKNTHLPPVTNTTPKQTTVVLQDIPAPPAPLDSPKGATLLQNGIKPKEVKKELVITPTNAEPIVITETTPVIVFDPKTNQLTETNGKVLLGTNIVSPKVEKAPLSHARLFVYYTVMGAIMWGAWWLYNRWSKKKKKHSKHAKTCPSDSATQAPESAPAPETPAPTSTAPQQ